MRMSAAILLLLWIVPGGACAAAGCELKDPDRTVRSLFPKATGYQVRRASIRARGGGALLGRIETRLGVRFQGPEESIDVPYAIYEVRRNTRCLGYIHGVNQKGETGGMQVFLALDPQGVIRELYFQKLHSRAARQLGASAFRQRFVGLGLKDFLGYDPAAGKSRPDCRVRAVANPAPGADADFRAVLRAVKKNLLLMDEFALENRHLGPGPTGIAP